MKKVLFYGDSNTWGYQSETMQRLALKNTWPYIVETELQKSSIELLPLVAGLNGRLTNIDDPTWPGRNGIEQLPTLLEMHDPLDVVIIALGVNDTKTRLQRQPEQILKAIEETVALIANNQWSLHSTSPKILVVTPTLIKNEAAYNNEFIGANDKIKTLSTMIEASSVKHKYTAFNTLGLTFHYCKDGVHLDPHDHVTLGTAISKTLTQIFDQ
jgi:lysophospholipase L1-like esterase